jgi:hypothetical protein
LLRSSLTPSNLALMWPAVAPPHHIITYTMSLVGTLQTKNQRWAMSAVEMRADMIVGGNMLNGWQVAAAVTMWAALAFVGAVVVRDVSAGFIGRF